MGEGDCSADSQRELMLYAEKLHTDGILSCLYSGRDCEIEDWMRVFDFIKVGSYKEECGSLFESTTNQKLFMKRKNGYQDITKRFWE